MEVIRITHNTFKKQINMKVNFEVAVKDFQGQPVKETIKNEKDGTVEEKILLMEDLIGKYLYACGDGWSADKKYEAYKLLRKINAAKGGIEIIDKESLLIKEACEKFLSSGAYGQVCELLNGK